jgi:site-specific DNA-methyltransferase (adenine-specific)
MHPDRLDFGTTFDLVIFSPPYANRFDYFEAFKMELWMGGFVKDRDDMLALRGASMRNNLAAPRHRAKELWGELRPFLDEMDDSASSVRMGIKGTLDGYFLDMRTLLRNLRAPLERRGTIAIVVGNSAYAKSIIPTDVLIARLGIEEGYKVKSIRIARRLHVSSQQRTSLSCFSDFMRESLVILEK